MREAATAPRKVSLACFARTMSNDYMMDMLHDPEIMRKFAFAVRIQEDSVRMFKYPALGTEKLIMGLEDRTS